VRERGGLEARTNFFSFKKVAKTRRGLDSRIYGNFVDDMPFTVAAIKCSYGVAYCNELCTVMLHRQQYVAAASLFQGSVHDVWRTNRC
jgi:hypothetical protein